MNPTIPGYRAHSPDNVKLIGFLPTRALQSAELNGLQLVANGKHDRVADALFTNGQIISGLAAEIIEGEEDYNLKIEAGKIYLKGDIVSVLAAELTIPLDTKVRVGIRYREQQITAEIDPSIKDPSPETDNYAEAGAFRIVYEHAWGWIDDEGAHDVNSTWEFFGILEIDNGVIIQKVIPGVSDAVRDLVEIYDRQSHGSYVISGLLTQYLSSSGGNYVFGVSGGTANIYGRKLNRTGASRINLPQVYDSQVNNYEPHPFVPDENNRCKLYLNETPLAVVSLVVGYRRTPENVVHSLVSGGTDTLSETSVASVISVVMGGTTYTLGVDFIVTGNDIDWSPAGIEPGPGQTYVVTYTYLDNITPFSVADTYVEVADLEPGTSVLINYTRKLPRMDLLVMTRENTLLIVKGLSQIANPAPPSSSADQIALATIKLDWINPPVVKNIAITNVPYSTLQDMRRGIENVFNLVAQLELRHKIVETDPTSKRGMFVDPLLDNNRRDQGVVQNGVVARGRLFQRIAAEVHDLPEEVANLPITLLSVDEVILEQSDASESTRINPYAAFDPIPAEIILSPSFDYWETNDTIWGETQIQENWIHWDINETVVTETSRALAVDSIAVIPNTHIRQIQVNFTIRGFGAGEDLVLATFDGVNVTP